MGADAVLSFGAALLFRHRARPANGEAKKARKRE